MQKPNPDAYTVAKKPDPDHELEAHHFRKALGQYATGICIITTVGDDGRYVGVTANSFNSVSLHPPLVLWSLAKQASSQPAFAKATHYGVSILAADQEDLSVRFSTYKGDRFEGLEVITSESGVPLIPGALAHLECRIKNRHDEGDHFIMVGEVEKCDYREGQALVYRSRKYFQV